MPGAAAAEFTICYPPLIIQFVMHAAVLGDYSILLIKLMIHPTCRAELVNARRRQRRPVKRPREGKKKNKGPFSLKKFARYPANQIFEYMHAVLNIVKKIINYIV